MRKVSRTRASVLAAGIAAVSLVTPMAAQADAAPLHARPAHARPAHARPAHVRPLDCTDPAYGPSTVNVGLSSVGKRFDVDADCSGGLADWSLETSLFYVYYDEPDYTFNPDDLTDADAGNYDITATTYDSDYNEDDFGGTFTLKRFDTWGSTFNASPEPVKKGATITFYGELLRANWDLGKYYGYGNGYTHLDFRPAGTPTFKTVKTFRTSTSAVGHIVGLSTKATVSGFWRVYYTGNEFGSAAYSTIDYVGVT